MMPERHVLSEKQKTKSLVQKNKTNPNFILYCLNHNVMCHETFWNWNAQQVLNLDYENLFR